MNRLTRKLLADFSIRKR